MTWSASSRFIRGVSTGDLKRPGKRLDHFDMLTRARFDHIGLHFRVGHTRTFWELAGYPTGRPLRLWSRGFWWIFTFDKNSPLRDHSKSGGQGFWGELSGADLTGNCAGADPGDRIFSSFTVSRSPLSTAKNHKTPPNITPPQI